jgi:hypothetical protein
MYDTAGVNVIHCEQHGKCQLLANGLHHLFVPRKLLKLSEVSICLDLPPEHVSIINIINTSKRFETVGHVGIIFPK